MTLVDLQALSQNPPSYQPQPIGESMFRETVLANRPTRIRPLDEALNTAYAIQCTMSDMAWPIAILRRAWERHNPGQQFYPADYRQDRRSAPLLSKVVRPLCAISSSLTWWTKFASRSPDDFKEREL